MNNFKQILKSISPNDNSIKELSDYLGYQLGKNPINPNSNWKILFTNRMESKSSGVIAVKTQKDLDNETSTIGIRKLFQQVISLKDEFGSSFSVSVVAFVGDKRIIFFKYSEGNRDTRLDINLETINKNIYLEDLSYLKENKIKIENDPFGFSADRAEVSDNVFKKELTTHFLSVISFYRKKLSELITGSKLRHDLSTLLSDEAKLYLSRDNSGINDLVQDESYTSSLSIVVDTIILRQLMRRFLEAYYGTDSFDVNDIALGVGSGTMDSAIKSAVKIANNIGDEKQITKLNRQQNPVQEQLNLFDDLFNKEEQEQTSKVELKPNGKKIIQDITAKSIEQFKLAYNGDLFAGSVAETANNVEKDIAKYFPEFLSKLWIDTSAGNYSFRYQDMPPEALEKQYEDSMSKDIQIKIDSETKEPIVYYGEDKQQQKNKGAYYTDERFVTYMVDNTVEVEFNKRYEQLKKALISYKSSNDINNLKENINNLIGIKIADFTAGGGSFLRGAFLNLAGQFNLIQNIELPEGVIEEYPMFKHDNNAQYQWEKYILENMIYGVDIDYKAIIISSLTLTLSSLEHRPSDTKLPQLIGRTLIHQNSLINSVPYYKRKEVFDKYKIDISKLIKYKKNNFSKFKILRSKLQDEILSKSNLGKITKEAKFMHIESIELNLPELFFNDNGLLREDSGVDIVIGNPPWDICKSNSDEFFSEYDIHFRKLGDKTKKKKRENELFSMYPKIKELWNKYDEQITLSSNYYLNKKAFCFQSWKSNDGDEYSSDINLYKIALERFIQLSNNNINVSVLVPDGLMTDEGTTGLRHLLFENYNVEEYLSFINQKRIFKFVHSGYKFAVLTFNKNKVNTDTFKAFFYRNNLKDLNDDLLKLSYKMETIIKYEPKKLSLFEARSNDSYILYPKIRNMFKPLGESKILKLGNDFHKTNDSDKFHDYHYKEKELLLYEGKFMDQFSILLPNEFHLVKNVNGPQCVDKSVFLKKKNICNEYKSYRIIIRTIASSTNGRTLISTLLPPNTTFTNSLNGQRESLSMSLNEKLFIIGFLNSYVLDYVIRNLVTSNINKTYLNQLPIPSMNEIDDSQIIIKIVKTLLQENVEYYKDLDNYVSNEFYKEVPHDELVAELNARIMISFELTRIEVLTLMETFKSKDHFNDVNNMTQKIIDFYDKLS